MASATVLWGDQGKGETNHGSMRHGAMFTMPLVGATVQGRLAWCSSARAGMRGQGRGMVVGTRKGETKGEIWRDLGRSGEIWRALAYLSCAGTTNGQSACLTTGRPMRRQTTAHHAHTSASSARPTFRKEGAHYFAAHCFASFAHPLLLLEKALGRRMALMRAADGVPLSKGSTARL